MKTSVAAFLYCGLMFYVAGFHGHGFLSFCCLFLVGPVLTLTSVVCLALAIKRLELRPATVLSPIICVSVIAAWYFQFGHICNVLRPKIFSMVAPENERLATSFMREQPSDTDIEVSGFRYPFHEIVPGGKLTVRHHAGVVSVKIPAFLNYPVFLVYVSPSSKMPYGPPNVDGIGWDATPLVEHWYYVRAVGI